MQHAYDGSLWLYDLNSLRGTKLNHQPVQPSHFQRLLPGNSIQFGNCSRMYVVQQGTPSRAATSHTKQAGLSFEEMAVAHEKAKKSGRDGAGGRNKVYSNAMAALRSAANAVKSRSDHEDKGGDRDGWS